MRNNNILAIALMALLAAGCNASSTVIVPVGDDASADASVQRDVASADLPAAEDRAALDGAPASDVVPGTDVPSPTDVPTAPADVPTAPADAPLSCPSGQILCGARCVDLQNDPGACGSCAMACASGESCVAGVCMVRCPSGQQSCAGRCVDLQTDRSHCGACGNVCPTGELCSRGMCTLECAAPTVLCGGGDAGTRACANTQTDRANCGGCGRACAMGELCEAGVCRLTCPAGQTACGGRCVSTDLDLMHCGACGNACPAGQRCLQGMCRSVCDPGVTDCGGGQCRNIQTDPNNCGACGRMCPAPSGGSATCALGACGIACGAGFGDCDLNTANGCETRLDGATNCGACGRTCAFANASAVCRNGACALGTCDTGFLDCDGNPGNGCEVNARTDRINCGRCANACASNQSCADGVCGTTCGAGAQLCGGVCVNPQNDPANCGACGNRCGAGPNQTAVCAAGRCDAVCTSGFANCDGVALNGCEVNIASSVAHCGGCSRACALPNATPLCQGGLCAVGACASGFRDCDGNPTNGCEVDVRTSSANCGACGLICNGTCSNGTCVTAPAQTFSASFSDSTTVLNAACSAWVNFRASLTGTGYRSITIYGSGVTTRYTCTNPAVVQQIVAGLRANSQFLVSCDGNTWSNCQRDQGEFWINPPEVCSGANCPNPGTIVRPCFNNTRNFSGVGINTCLGPPQTITIEVR